MDKCKDCQRWLEEYDKDVFCDECPAGRPDNRFGFHAKDMVKLNSISASKAQLDELGRRVILPYEKPDGGYYVGRRGENGRVQERNPDYRP